ncbi:MAG: EamA family transporter [Micromonosporaceae bacterium]
MSTPYVSHARNRGSGLALALVAAVAFGGSGAFAKPLIEAGITPLQVTWLRVAGAAVVLLPLLVRHRAVVRRHPGLLVTYGLTAIAGCQAFYFAALSRIPVGVAILLEFMGPVLVLLWLRFGARRHVSRRAALGVLLAVTGLAMVVEVWAGLRLDPLGLLLGFGAACCQAFYFVLGDREDAEPIDPRALISYGLLFGAIALTLVSQPWRIDWAVLGTALPVGSGTAPALALLAWVVLIATVVAYLTGISALRRLSAQVAAAVACLEVVVAAAVAWVALGEALSVVQIIGGGVVLAGAFIAQAATAIRAPSPELSGSEDPEPAPAPV